MGRYGLCGSTAGHGRREQAVPPVLVWAAGARRPEVKKHYGRWMDIVRSLELESFILTKMTKPSVPVILVGPQFSLPPRWVPVSREYSFFCA